MSKDCQVALVAHLFTLPEAAVYLNVSERQLRNLVYLRRVPFTKVGRLLRFPKAELDKWLAANTVHCEGGAA